MRNKHHIHYLRSSALMALLCCVATTVFAQQKHDTLHTVHIHSKHKRSADIKLNEFASGQKVQSIDSNTLQQYAQQNVAALLSQQVPVFVKSYSFNGLATLSFRGASAAQSQVLWNGIPIQNAALGVADISSLPVQFMNKVNIVYGGSGALYGSGNVGGALLLEDDKPVFDTARRSLSVNAGGGSFGQYSGGIKGSISRRRWYIAGNVFAQTATNNYTYTNSAGNEQEMTNAKLQSKALILHTAYKINEQNSVGIAAWWQQYDRQIPPALFESYSVKKQQDKSIRVVADWQQEKEKYTLYAKASLIHDAIDYNDSAVQLHTSNAVFQYYQEVGWKRQLGNYGKLLLFAPIQISWLPSGNDTQQQKRFALAAAYDVMVFDRLEVSVQARAEKINTQNIFLPGAGAAYAITNWLAVRANVQRTYRMPTLNELYYFPGGNAALKPEQGWNEDAGYAVKTASDKFTFHHDASVFNRRLHDWILWLGGAVWTPHNIATVHSRGIETDNKITFAAGLWRLHMAVGTSYILSTTAESYLPNDGSIDKQIPYTPRYNGRMNIGFSRGRLYANYNHTYTGYRFITTDESSWLQPYQTGNVLAMYTLPLKDHQLQLTAQCNNVWNQHYSVAGFRPMPGINWLGGLKVTL